MNGHTRCAVFRMFRNCGDSLGKLGRCNLGKGLGVEQPEVARIGAANIIKPTTFLS